MYAAIVLGELLQYVDMNRYQAIRAQAIPPLLQMSFSDTNMFQLALYPLSELTRVEQARRDIIGYYVGNLQHPEVARKYLSAVALKYLALHPIKDDNTNMVYIQKINGETQYVNNLLIQFILAPNGAPHARDLASVLRCLNLNNLTRRRTIINRFREQYVAATNQNDENYLGRVRDAIIWFTMDDFIDWKYVRFNEGHGVHLPQAQIDILYLLKRQYMREIFEDISDDDDSDLEAELAFAPDTGPETVLNSDDDLDSDEEMLAMLDSYVRAQPLFFKPPRKLQMPSLAEIKRLFPEPAI